MKKEPTSRRELLLLLAAIGLAAGLRVYDLGAQPLWLDEATTADYAESGLIGSIFAEPPNPPLFYVIEYLVVSLLGGSETALRLPAAIFGILAVPAAWALARRLFPQPRITAPATAVLAAVSPFLVYLSQEARGYSLVILLTLLSTLVFLRFCESEARAPQSGGASPPLRAQGAQLILYMALSALLLYTHYFGAWVLLAHEAVYWLHLRRRPREWLLARANIALAFLPWAMWAVEELNLGSVAWVGSALVRAPYTLLRDLVGYGIAPQMLWGQPAEVILREEGWAVGLTAAPLLWLLVRGAWQILRVRSDASAPARADAAMRRTLLLALLMLPMAALIAVSPWAKLLHERAVSFQSPFVVMLMAFGWATLRTRARIVAGLAAGAAIAFALLAYYGAPGELLGYPLRFGKENWPSVAAHLEEQQPDAAIVRPGYLHLALRRYWHAPERMGLALLEDGPQMLKAEAAAVQRFSTRRCVALVIAWGGEAEPRLRARLAQTHHLVKEEYFPMQGGLYVLTYEKSDR